MSSRGDGGAYAERSIALVRRLKHGRDILVSGADDRISCRVDRCIPRPVPTCVATSYSCSQGLRDGTSFAWAELLTELPTDCGE